MGSYPTLDHRELAAETHELAPDDWTHPHAAAHLAADYPQVRSWTDDNPDLAHELDHRHPSRERDVVLDAEEAFDRLNPTFGVPADRSDRIGHRDVAQRERALSHGVRVAVHDSRQNEPDPVIRQPGQDYRVADALHAARREPTRRGPERLGPER